MLVYATPFGDLTLAQLDGMWEVAMEQDNAPLAQQLAFVIVNIRQALAAQAA